MSQDKSSTSSSGSPSLQITLAVLMLAGSIVASYMAYSGKVAAVNAEAAASAAQSELQKYHETFVHSAEMSSRMDREAKDLADPKQQQPAAIRFFSYHTVADRKEDKRSLAYSVIASDNAHLAPLFGAFLQRSGNSDDKSIADEFRKVTAAVIQAEAGPTGAKDAPPPARGNSPEAVRAQVLAAVTASNATGWVWLGDATRNAVGSTFVTSEKYITATGVPGRGRKVGFSRSVHLRDPNRTTVVVRGLPSIVGIVESGLRARIVDGDPTLLDLGSGTFAVWARIQLASGSEKC